MPELLVICGLVAASYLSGCVPYGLLVGRALGVDVRQTGSGNIGATNVGRALGARWAALVLLLDAAKGFLPLMLARHLLPPETQPWPLALCMLAAVGGHVFSVFLRFRGGKGVATGLGVTIAIDPLAAAAGACGYALVFAAVRISAVGSLTGLFVAVAVMAYRDAPGPILAALALIACLILARHRDNLEQLVRDRRRAGDTPRRPRD